MHGLWDHNMGIGDCLCPHSRVRVVGIGVAVGLSVLTFEFRACLGLCTYE